LGLEGVNFGSDFAILAQQTIVAATKEFGEDLNGHNFPFYRGRATVYTPISDNDPIMRDSLPSSASVRVMQALDSHPTLKDLASTLQRSSQRLQAVRSCMAESLWKTLKPGPSSDDHWVILTPQAAVAARLKWLKPALEAQLLETEGKPVTIDIRVFAGK
jgi:hypothetical protein